MSPFDPHPSTAAPGVVWSMEWTEETVGPHTFRLLTAKSHEDAADQAARKLDLSRPEHRKVHAYATMFAVLWPVARAGAWALSSMDLRGKRVLEVGCGLGLLSLMAAKKGAEVVATDHHPDAMTLVQRNARANGLEIETALMDWRTPPDLGRFDWVVASDVLFSFDGASPLAHTFQNTLKPGGVGWVIDPARPWHDAFERHARALGLAPKTRLIESPYVDALLTELVGM